MSEFDTESRKFHIEVDRLAAKLIREGYAPMDAKREAERRICADRRRVTASELENFLRGKFAMKEAS